MPKGLGSDTGSPLPRGRPRLRPLFLYSAVVSWSGSVIAKNSSISAGRRRALALAAFVALGLSDCGRIGPLEPPPEANAPPKPAPTAAESALNPQVKPKIPPITAPKQPFILDPLLK